MEQMGQKEVLLRNISVSGISKNGFTFLELLVVMMLIGIMATLVVPNLRHLVPNYRHKEFIAHFNSLTQLAWQNALITQKLHRVWFDINKKIVRVEIEKPIEHEGEKKEFVLVQAPYISAQYTVPDSIEIQNFYVEGTDMLRQPGIKTETIWFYVVPDGMVQEVIINAVDTRNLDEQEKPKQFSIIINPFTAHMTTHETFTKP